MIRPLAALLLALHGVIHLIGFVVPWRLAAVDGFAYRTTALGNAIELGDAGARLAGLGWLAVAIGFLVAAAGTWRGAAWARALMGSLALASILLCALGLPETVAGIVVNVGILAALAIAAFAGAQRHPSLR